MTTIDVNAMLIDGAQAEFERALAIADARVQREGYTIGTDLPRLVVAQLMIEHANAECEPLHEIIRSLRAAFSPVQQEQQNGEQG